MIFMADAYDASEVDERPRSSHLSRKDVRILGVVALALILLMTPIYLVFKSNRDRHLCQQNLSQMAKAMGTYLAENNDRYPPLFVEGEGRQPQLFDGKIYSWVSLLHSGMNTRSSFNCPSAEGVEAVKNLNPEPHQPDLASTYGMYVPWATWNSTMIINPDQAILIVETSNHGALDSFDPLPFSHGQDGVAVGYDDDNWKVTTNSEFVTRLAFPNSKGGRFRKEGAGRHGDSIFGLSASGQLLTLKQPAARINRLPNSTEIIGLWATR